MIELSVGDVRTALLRASGPEHKGDGQPASLLLGRVFHEVFAELISADSPTAGLRVIVEAGPTRQRRVELLQEHIWQRLLAPRLLRHGALLHDSSDRVVTLWQATQNLAGWLIDIVLELLEQSVEARAQAHHLAEHIRAEVPVSCEFFEPGWTEPVNLVGVADSLLHVPTKETYCAIELKLGQNTPAVDLGQVALYHLILTRSKKIDAGSSLGLVRFTPALDETVVAPDELTEAQARLLKLIGGLAKVLPPTRPAPGKTRASETKTPGPNPIPSAAVASGTAHQPETTPEAHQELGRGLLKAFKEHGVGLELRGEPQAGPRFLRFEVRLAERARLASVRSYTKEVQHRLGLEFEPMVSQDAGRLYLDVARPDPETILFSSLLGQLDGIDELRGSARVPIGVNAGGKLQFVDIGSSGRSHVLVAGTAGSGKSEWLRLAVAGLIASNTPDTLRFVTIDPKLAAFNDMEKSRFLWKRNSWWVHGDGRPANDVFEELITEMNRRYQLTREAGVDNLTEYVEKVGKPLPRIVCICDEYFALISESRDMKREIEHAVSLLGAKARAAGINLILATQQPSRATISGAIQANLQCRVALTLTSPIESNMILGEAGAERLTLRGDLLYKDFGNPIRLQAPYLPEAERIRWLRG